MKQYSKYLEIDKKQLNLTIILEIIIDIFYLCNLITLADN